MKELVRRSLDNAPSGVHVEARYHSRMNTQILIEKGELKTATVDDFAGIGIRVLVNGAWGYASTSILDLKSVDETLDNAISAATAVSKSKKEKVELAPIEPVEGTYSNLGKDPFENHSIEEMVELFKEADKTVNDYDNRISGSFTSLRVPQNHRIIMNSDGTDVEILDSRPDFILRAVASEGGTIVPAYSAHGITGGWEIFDRSPTEMAKQAADYAIKLLKAPFPKGGEQTVVMHPSVVGIICHEAIGHTVESDFVMAGSAAKGKIGKRIASEMVTLVDSGNQMAAAGWLAVDDAGVQSESTVIIEKGVMKSYLHSRHSAHHFGVEPTGNERAFEYNVEPLIRMRNTYLEAGDFSYEEILEGIDFGYLCVEPGGGQADSSAEFMFEMSQAYEIVDGEIGSPVRSLALTGNAFDVLMSIDAIGKDWKLGMGCGHCGKGQLAKVDGGGGTTRARTLVSGGGG